MLQFLCTTLRVLVLLVSGLLLPALAVRQASWHGLQQWIEWVQGTSPSQLAQPPSETPFATSDSPAKKTSFPVAETFSSAAQYSTRLVKQPAEPSTVESPGRVQPVAAWESTPRAHSSTQRPSTPISVTPVHNQPLVAATAAADQANGWQPWQRELEALGAVYCRLDSWEERSWHRFQCRVAVPGKLGHSRHLEGSGNSVAAAVEQVLETLRSLQSVRPEAR